ncbi:MAG: MotA/TolQ/ExbB proton channel family protein [Deltaproteobacteria bacterium]|nr:MotA/TolQ/ExbB proton channel family protein [Deltaproteobacteria bacterium]MBW2419972.1 MotA/TolQ/ExbB proton channel family protein [Deltaproteobacteria bacterium]
MDFAYSIVGFFVTGGPFMYPILLVFAVGAAIAIERYVTLTQVRSKNQSAWSEVLPALSDGDFDSAREIVGSDDATISQLLSMGLARQGAVRRREDIEIAMEESMMEIIPQLEKRTPYVGLASSIATLLGLLGTIMGLISAFTAVANANPAEKADLLSASISVAMNTTAFGLMVAIPLLVTSSVLTAKTGEIIDSLEMASVKALNVISARAKQQVEA